MNTTRLLVSQRKKIDEVFKEADENEREPLYKFMRDLARDYQNYNRQLQEVRAQEVKKVE